MQDESRRDLHPPISIEIKDIYQKIVVEGQHGYCFENNLLLGYVLFSLGYQVICYNAHIVRNNIPKEDPQHIVLAVTLNGKEYLVDAGYGGVTPIGITEFTIDAEQAGACQAWHTTHNTPNQYKLTQMRFAFENGTEENGLQLNHYFHLPDEEAFFWKPLYVFKKESSAWEQIATANFRACADKTASPFNHRVFETMFCGNGSRVSVTQDELLITQYGRIILWKPVPSQEKYKKYLKKHLQTTENGNIQERVTFGNASDQCKEWHQSYKAKKV